MNNIDQNTVDSFGDEWSRFNQSSVSYRESEKNFNDYFKIFPWDSIGIDSEGFDMGCGSGRWAKFVAPKVRHLNCIDPSNAIIIARKNLGEYKNISFINDSVSGNILKANSQDFGYSLGVLHHVPNTFKAIKSCVRLLKPGAPLLIYLYYSFDNRSVLYKLIWKLSNIFRKVISKLHPEVKNIITDIIALFVYFPLSKLAKIIDFFGLSSRLIPLSYYRDHSFYTMRTDSRDRFGTPLENRFSKEEISDMMARAGMVDIKFSNGEPFWCAVGFKSIK
jgi:ubiquinone/menaquinone biosynthesis C-methylase UbiE